MAPGMNTVLPNGFRAGLFSERGMYDWLKYSVHSTRTSQIISVAWYSSHHRPFHHQFIIATIRYVPPSNTPGTLEYLYILRIERVGKLLGWGRLAKQQYTLSDPRSSVEYLETADLVCRFDHLQTPMQYAGTSGIEATSPSLEDVFLYDRLVGASMP